MRSRFRNGFDDFWSLLAKALQFNFQRFITFFSNGCRHRLLFFPRRMNVYLVDDYAE